MTGITLEHHNRRQVLASMTDDAWVVSCLCAAWCGSCREYRAIFDQLAAAHPAVQWIWIDIEDQADVVGDIDVENFPSLLIQRGDIVAFFGEVAPTLQLAERLVSAQIRQTEQELRAEALSSSERQMWQRDYNVRALLGKVL